ncbi:MAG TPA: PQQ-binding-like beta-propeller repeat protein, partial [Acidimicrobiia bacterium]
PTLHNLIGQLVEDSVTSTRLQGSYGSGVGPFYELNLGGYTWYEDYGGTPGLPALVATRAFVPVGDDIYGDDPAQGCPPLPTPDPPPDVCAPTWQAALPGAPNTPVGIGTARIAVSDASGVVTALNAATGKTAWASSSFHTPLGQPVSSATVVYVGGADGLLRAISATNGKVIWTANAGAPIRTAPTLSGSRVYVATDNGRLVALPAAGCGKAACAPAAVGNAALPNTQAAGAPLIRNNIAVVAYGTHLIAFTV